MKMNLCCKDFDTLNGPSFVNWYRRYRIGEAFLHVPHPRALQRLESDQKDIEQRISTFSASSEECRSKMKELKIVLYAKFGSAINLDD